MENPRYLQYTTHSAPLESSWNKKNLHKPSSTDSPKQMSPCILPMFTWLELFPVHSCVFITLILSTRINNYFINSSTRLYLSDWLFLPGKRERYPWATTLTWAMPHARIKLLLCGFHSWQFWGVLQGLAINLLYNSIS